MRSSEEVRVVVAQPHELLCDALESLLGPPPDVALVDAELTDVAEVVGVVRRGLPEVRIVLLARGLDPGVAQASLELEVAGVVLKCASARDVVATLRRIVAGDTVFPAGWLAAAHRVETAARRAT